MLNTASIVPTTRTVKVKVRHSSDCKDLNQGADWRRCNCPKALLIYDGGGTGTNRRVSAKTRSWERAEKLAQEYLDRFDPDKQELKRLRAEKERAQVTVEEAVALYVADMIARLSDNGTVAMVRSLLGHVDPETKAVTKNGNLFNWLSTLTSDHRPTYIFEVNPAHVTGWRSTWTFGDYTASQRWGMVKSFFNFCEAQGWIQASPCRNVRRLEYEKGGRTAVFTDEQCAAILEAVSLYDPVPEQLTQKSWQQRLTAFVELLHWSGMSMIDAVQFRPELVDDAGVLRYRRQKTKSLATVVLPQHVVAILRDVPPERDSVGASMPFRMKECSAYSDTRIWRKRLFVLFDLAGIKLVRTELGAVRRPHPAMFRDTFAVWHLRHGSKIHNVAKMLGHSRTATTEKSYLPWVAELEQAHIEDARRVLAQAAPKTRGKKVVPISSNL